MSCREEAKKQLDQVLRLAQLEKKKTGFCIGNTAKEHPKGYFFSPIRNTHHLVAASAIVFKPHFAEEIASEVDGKVEYLLLDTEKKAGPEPQFYGPTDLGNIERVVRLVIRKSKILTYKGNDLTVDSIDACLAQLTKDTGRGIGGKKVVILGAGNLGSKLALKFVERGANVTITRRDENKLRAIVEALNHIKPSRTAAKIVGTTDNEKAADGADILIGTTNGTAVITAAMIDRLSPHALIMDGGKGCLHPEAVERADSRSLSVMRIDIRAGFEGQVACLLETERLLETQALGRRHINGVCIVSGGLLGKAGEIIVDNVENPSLVFGMADGRGDLIQNMTEEQLGKIESIRISIANAYLKH